MALSLISQLAHVELTTPKPQESLDFWTNVIGLEETAREGQSVYLRGWGDRFHHTLKLTEAPQAGLDHIGWRTFGADELDTAVKRLEQAGAGIGWQDGSAGHGPAYRYHSPGGHVHEIFWEVELYKAPAGQESPFPNRPQVFVPRGVGARCIDHVTIATSNPGGDAEWMRDTLGHRYMEYTVIPDRPDFVVFCMTTTCERAHDLGMAWDPTPARGRINHFAYYVENTDNLLRAADVLINAGTEIEFGPGKHGMGEQGYLYFREPSGLRIELNSGGYRNYEPDFATVRFEPQVGSNVFYRNLAMPHSMLENFPTIEMSSEEVSDASETSGLFV
jgi:catechol 2,3-dioxygenase